MSDSESGNDPPPVLAPVRPCLSPRCCDDVISTNEDVDTLVGGELMRDLHFCVCDATDEDDNDSFNARMMMMFAI